MAPVSNHQSHPAAFARYAKLIVEGKEYNDLDKLWRACSPDAALQRDLHNAKVNGPPDFGLLQRMADVHARLRKSGSNRGHRQQQPATQAVKAARQATAAKGCPILHEMRIADDHFFGDAQAGKPLEQFYVQELSESSVGYCFATTAIGTVMLKRHLNAEPFTGICTMVCKHVAFEQTAMEHRAAFTKRYRPVEMMITFIDNNGHVYDVKCLIFNFGKREADSKAVVGERLIKISTDAAKYIRMSVQIPNLKNAADFEVQGKADFVKNAEAMVGTANLYGEGAIRHTRTRTLNYFKGTVQVHEGEAKVKREKVLEVLRRNGLNGAFIKHWGPDETYVTLPLGPRATLEEARSTAAGIKNLAYGVCITARGIGIRVRKDEEPTARNQYDPALAEPVGEAALKLKRHEGHMFVINNVPFSMSDRELAVALTMPGVDGGKPWQAKPITKLGGARYGYKNILVQSSSEPHKNVIRLTYGIDKVTLVIQEYVAPASKRSVVDKIMEREEPAKSEPAPTEEKQTMAEPTKRMPKQWSQVVKTHWSNIAAREENDDMNIDDDCEDIFEPSAKRRGAREECQRTDSTLDCSASSGRHCGYGDVAACRQDLDGDVDPANELGTPRWARKASTTVVDDFEEKMRALEEQRQAIVTAAEAAQQDALARDAQHSERMDKLFSHPPCSKPSWTINALLSSE
jgi:hypothetical protein